MHLVSVIIPTRNRAALLREAIESVLAVSRAGFEIEVIVIDDGSDDTTPELVATYPVRYLRLDGRGAAAARNAGIDAARGDLIAFLDDDDLWLPGNIAPHIALLDRHPELGAAYAQAQLTHADRTLFGVPVPQGPLRSGWIHGELLRHWPQIGAVVVRASVAREVGGLDLSLRSEEEWDWLLRIAQRYPIGCIEQPVVLFRQRGHGDEARAWQRLPDTMRVLRRHIRRHSFAAQVRLVRLYWAHRGWYAGGFLAEARAYARDGDRRRSLRCVRYALGASPLHVLKAALPRPGIRGWGSKH